MDSDSGGDRMQQIVIRKPRCVLVLLDSEVMEMLKQNPSIWSNALKRGKGLIRYERSRERKG